MAEKKSPVQPAPDAELLKVEEVAFVLRTTVGAVYAQIERGKMPGLVRMGRHLRVRRDDLRKAYGLGSAQPQATGSSSPRG